VSAGASIIGALVAIGIRRAKTGAPAPVEDGVHVEDFVPALEAS
jgi:hypothetical protein